jgi:peptide/nickel transport system permease protein
MPDSSSRKGVAASTDTHRSPARPTVDDGGDASPLTDPARVPVVDEDPVLATEKLEAGALAGQASGGDDVEPSRRRKPRNILFWLALGWIGIVVFAAITADWLPLKDPNAISVRNKLEPPFSNPEFILGTDGLGRDLLSRLAYGARVSLVISTAAVSIGLLAGGTLGMIAGFFRGRLESILMAIINVILAFPGLVLLLGLVAVVGQSLPAITVVVGLLSIPIYARVARATTLAVAQREYVLAARAMGATNTRILIREILPNVILPVMAFGLIALGIIIVLEGTLAFLGLSVQPPAATWGSTIAEGKRHLTTTAHVAFLPSLVMFLTVLSINFVGDSLRSRFDVKESAL